MKLTYDDFVNLAKGASLLTTGGGLCLEDQLTSLEKHKNMSLELQNIEDLHPDTLLITASEVGTADAKEMDKTDILPKMLITWQKLTGRTIGGVYAPELGQESIMIDTAIGTGVPLIDFDVAGGRAVPFVDINSFYALGKDYSLAPLVVGTDEGDILAADTPMSIHKVETFLRPLSSLSKGGIAYFIGGAIRARDVLNSGIPNNSLSRSIKLGTSKNLDEIISLITPYLTLKGRVIKKTEIRRNGFNCFEADFKTDNGEILSLFILNEVLFIKDKNGISQVSPPDKILIIDEHTLTGVSTKDLLSGKDVILCASKADSLWNTDTARAIFGPERFL